jgi:hypothetical protein
MGGLAMKKSMVLGVVILLFLLCGVSTAITGAIFTTDDTCSGVNVNLFGSKEDVYLDGGPHHEGAAGLPDGSYFVRVTEPDGTLLGTSNGSSNDLPVEVTGGVFDTCYQLWDILIKASDGTQGYDDTTNPGREYKVWVSMDPEFPPSDSATDNFKVNESEGGELANLTVLKFYDQNANGMNDDEQLIEGWKIRITDGLDLIRYTLVSIFLGPDDYTVMEFTPVEMNWQNTTTSSVNITLGEGGEETVEFGNLCLGPGGGHTLGFWSNKNGQSLIGSNDLALLVSLNLRNGDGTNFDPANNAAFRTWILGATATNMANMLSAQLAAMELNVFNDFVDGSALIYAPNTTSANALGYASVNDIMAEANATLGADGFTPAGDTNRTYQEALKNILDHANNNLNFVQPTPCSFTFW